MGSLAAQRRTIGSVWSGGRPGPQTIIVATWRQGCRQAKE
jgi:hypothetical protein